MGNDYVSARCNRMPERFIVDTMGEKLAALFFPTEKIANPPKKVDANAIRRDKGKYLEKVTDLKRTLAGKIHIPFCNQELFFRVQQYVKIGRDKNIFLCVTLVILLL